MKGNATALFGLFVCIALSAPAWAFVVGFLCLLVDERS